LEFNLTKQPPYSMGECDFWDWRAIYEDYLLQYQITYRTGCLFFSFFMSSLWEHTMLCLRIEVHILVAWK
jgi:hypothetical protein